MNKENNAIISNENTGYDQYNLPPSYPTSSNVIVMQPGGIQPSTPHPIKWNSDICSCFDDMGSC